MEERKFYRCNHCGNLFGIINDGGVNPICCGEDMELLKPNTTDAAGEKHVPELKRDGDRLHVQVGSVAHPMLAEHYIQWIIAAQDNRVQRIFLCPGDKPEADFVLYDAKSPVIVYEYCNLHGLWSAKG